MPADVERSYTEAVSLALSMPQLRQLRADASDAGMAVGAFLRELALEAHGLKHLSVADETRPGRSYKLPVEKPESKFGLRVVLKLTEKQRAALHLRAAELGVSLSVLLRSAAGFKDAAPPRGMAAVVKRKRGSNKAA